MVTEPRAAVDLYWLPLGAGGQFVRMNGRVYEALCAWRGKRPRRDLYHSALTVSVPAGQFVIEQAWPIPTGDRKHRGVVAEGPVGTKRVRSLRFLRYEVRRWRGGVIADLDEAVESPQRLTDDVIVAERVLELVPEVPTPVWGRDEVRAGEMWNSNSLISWLLARAGLDVGGRRRAGVRGHARGISCPRRWRSRERDQCRQGSGSKAATGVARRRGRRGDGRLHCSDQAVDAELGRVTGRGTQAAPRRRTYSGRDRVDERRHDRCACRGDLGLARTNRARPRWVLQLRVAGKSGWLSDA
jgi:hypothetical protein